jgi:hypothetical protein
MKYHPFSFRRPSNYVAMGVWGAAGFMAQPTLASFIVHFAVLPLLLALTLWLAHLETRSNAVTRQQEKP